MKTLLKKLLSDAKLVSIAIFVLSAFALAAAFTSQYVFHMMPCPLCLAQRVPYAVTALLGLIAFALAFRKPKKAALLVFVCAAVFLVGAGIAALHTGVEQHWWESPIEGCKVSFGNDESAKSWLERIEATAAAPCDKAAWTDPLLHLSMAAWNLIASLALSLASLFGSIFIVRKANGF